MRRRRSSNILKSLGLVITWLCLSLFVATILAVAIEANAIMILHTFRFFLAIAMLGWLPLMISWASRYVIPGKY